MGTDGSTVVSFEEFMAMGLALPQVTERVTWGSDHTLRIGEKMFAVGAPGSEHVTVKATKVDQTELIAADPLTFSVAPYVGRFGWVRIALEHVDPGELHELLTEAWRRTAPKRLVRQYDEAAGEGGAGHPAP